MFTAGGWWLLSVGVVCCVGLVDLVLQLVLGVVGFGFAVALVGWCDTSSRLVWVCCGLLWFVVVLFIVADPDLVVVCGVQGFCGALVWMVL